MAWTIKQMTQLSGVPADSLRYYDKIGLISPKRAENGYRYYDEIDYMYLQYVCVMKYAQFSLLEIAFVLNSIRSQDCETSNRASLAVFTGKRAALLDMVQNYQNIVQLFDKLLPLMRNGASYIENEKQIKTFVADIFKRIRGNAAITTEDIR